MNTERTGKLTDAERATIEVEIDVKLWGQPHRITPRCVSHIYGDGGLWMMIQPLNTRPNYYVCAVDTHMEDSNDEREDPFYGMLQELELTIEEEYGSTDDEQYCGGDGLPDFPVASFDSGCTWWFEKRQTPERK